MKAPLPPNKSACTARTIDASDNQCPVCFSFPGCHSIGAALCPIDWIGRLSQLPTPTLPAWPINTTTSIGGSASKTLDSMAIHKTPPRLVLASESLALPVWRAGNAWIDPCPLISTPRSEAQTVEEHASQRSPTHARRAQRLPFTFCAAWSSTDAWPPRRHTNVSGRRLIPWSDGSIPIPQSAPQQTSAGARAFSSRRAVVVFRLARKEGAHTPPDAVGGQANREGSEGELIDSSHRSVVGRRSGPPVSRPPGNFDPSPAAWSIMKHCTTLRMDAFGFPTPPSSRGGQQQHSLYGPGGGGTGTGTGACCFSRPLADRRPRSTTHRQQLWGTCGAKSRSRRSCARTSA